MHAVANRMTRANYALRDSLNNRNNLGINTDLQQVSEDQVCGIDMNIFKKTQQSVRRSGNPATGNDCVSSNNDDGRTLTPNSQRFIFQAQFENN